MTSPLTFALPLHCSPSTLSRESPLRSGGRCPGAPERAGVTGACGFINKYLSVCRSNEQGSNLKWSEQPPGMQTSGTGCSRQSNVKVHQRGISSLPAPIQTDIVMAEGVRVDPDGRRGQTGLFRPLLPREGNFRSFQPSICSSRLPENVSFFNLIVILM